MNSARTPLWVKVCGLRSADAVAAAIERHGHLDVVWANAGLASFGPLAHTDPVAWQRCIEVNVLGVFHTVRAALPAIMRRRVCKSSDCQHKFVTLEQVTVVARLRRGRGSQLRRTWAQTPA